MTHDPLCPIISTTCIDGPHVLILEAALGYYLCDSCQRECQCDLISRVEDRCTPNYFRKRIEKLITKANLWRDENVELRKQLKELK
jgi:hypothetical protein